MKTIITLEEKNLNRLKISKEVLNETIDQRMRLFKGVGGIFKNFLLLEELSQKNKNFTREMGVVSILEKHISTKGFEVGVKKFEYEIDYFLIEVKNKGNYVGRLKLSALFNFNISIGKEHFVIWELEQESELFIEVLMCILSTFEILAEDLYFLSTDCWTEYLEENCGFEKISLKPYKYSWYDANFYKKPWDKFVTLVEEK